MEGEASGEQLPGGQRQQQCYWGHQRPSGARQIYYYRYTFYSRSDKEIHAMLMYFINFYKKNKCAPITFIFYFTR